MRVFRKQNFNAGLILVFVILTGLNLALVLYVPLPLKLIYALTFWLWPLVVNDALVDAFRIKPLLVFQSDTVSFRHLWTKQTVPWENVKKTIFTQRRIYGDRHFAIQIRYQDRKGKFRNFYAKAHGLTVTKTEIENLLAENGVAIDHESVFWQY